MHPWNAQSPPALGYDRLVRESSWSLRPAWALLGVAAGTTMAILLVPAVDYWHAGMLVGSALAMAAGLLFGPVLSGLRHPGTAFRTEHVLMLGLVYWVLLDVFQSSYRLWDVSAATVQAVFLYTGLFAGFLWLGSAIASVVVRPSPARAEPDIGPQFLFWSGVACFACGFAQPTVTCGFDPGCLWRAFWAPRFDVPWFSGPGVKGLNTLLQNLKYFGYLTLPILVALRHAEGRTSWRVVVLAPLTLLFLALLLRDGGRKELGSVLGAGMLTWILLRPRLRWRHFAFVAGAIAGVLLLLQVMVTWRSVGVARIFEEDTAPKQYRGITVDWNFDWMAHLMQTVPERAPHTGWTGVVYIVGYPIPRSVWPGKPVMRGIDLPKQLGRSYAPGFSWNCTAICDFYLIGGGLIVAVGGFLYGMAANFVSRLLFRPPSVPSRLLFAVATMTLFLALRTAWELVAQGVTVLAVWLLLATHWLVRRPAA